MLAGTMQWTDSLIGQHRGGDYTRDAQHFSGFQPEEVGLVCTLKLAVWSPGRFVSGEDKIGTGSPWR